MFTAMRRIRSAAELPRSGVVLLRRCGRRLRAQTQASEATLDEVVVTARKREETLLDVPVTDERVHRADDPVRGNRVAARLRRAGAEHDPGRGAERRQLVHHHPRHLAGAQQRALGRGAGRRRARDQPLRVRPAADRHQADRGAEGAAGRACTGATPSAARSSSAPPIPRITSRAPSRPESATACPRRAQLALGGPIDSGGTLGYRASLNYYNTDGYLENTYLDRKADPYRDYSGRLRLLWKPSDDWSRGPAGVPSITSRRTAYYYIIPRDDEANPFSTLHDAAERERRHQPDPGQQPRRSDNRDVTDIALKLDYKAGTGHLHGGLGLQPHQGDRYR